MRIDDIDQAGTPGAVTGRLQIDPFAGERLDRLARSHPLVVVHGVIGQPRVEGGRERAARGFALRAGFSGFRLPRCDQRALASPSEKRQADRHPGRDIIAEARIAVLIGGFYAKIGLAVSIGKSNIGSGLNDAGFDRRECGIGIKRSADA